MLLLSGGSGAFADGDIFFHLDVFDTSSTPIDEQVIFAGNVKDTDGNYIVDAIITVTTIVATPRGERQISYNAYTDVVGRYRTLDVESVVLAFEEQEYEVNPSDVKVTVEKEGYETIRRLDRSRRTQTGGIVEVNFVMARIGSPSS